MPNMKRYITLIKFIWSKVNQVIYSSAPISLPIIKALANFLRYLVEKGEMWLMEKWTVRLNKSIMPFTFFKFGGLKKNNKWLKQNIMDYVFYVLVLKKKKKKTAKSNFIWAVTMQR